MFQISSAYLRSVAKLPPAALMPNRCSASVYVSERAIAARASASLYLGPRPTNTCSHLCLMELLSQRILIALMKIDYWGTGIRTPIAKPKTWSLAIRRSPNWTCIFARVAHRRRQWLRQSTTDDLNWSVPPCLCRSLQCRGESLNGHIGAPTPPGHMCQALPPPPRGTLPPPAPASLAGPLAEEIPSTLIDFRPRLSFSRPSLELTSRPERSRMRSSR
jgi:hypothetical protein